MAHAFIFPGQGSQSVGMLADLATVYPIVQQTFAEASEVLGYDLWQLSQIGPKETLDQTDKTQPALLAASVSIWRIWQQCGGVQPKVMAGHSFGEYSALVCAESLEFTEAIHLAQDRGRFMQQAVPEGEGAMAAVLGLTDEQIQTVCDDTAQGQVVTAVNFNAPGQVVIAGHKTAVERALIQAKAAGSKKAILLPVSVPAHSILMKPAADQMAKRITTVNFRSPKIPIIHNVDITTKNEPEAIRQALVAQLYHPVNWVKTIQAIENLAITTLFEAGPGKVLNGLNKRITSKLVTLSLGSVENFAKAMESLS